MARIMVVDDDAGIIFLVRMMLEKAGHEVIEACSGEECLRKLVETRPELVFLDVMMPSMNGWEVCKRIKENPETNSLPVCMLSVRKEPEDMKKSLEYAGADMHLGKPIDQKKLTEAVDRLLKKPRG